jgi:hypothetical protein
MDVQKHKFEVTEKAGSFVAGMRSPGAGKELLLTEEQAAYALRAGELKRSGARAKAAAKPKPDKPEPAKAEAPKA